MKTASRGRLGAAFAAALALVGGAFAVFACTSFDEPPASDGSDGGDGGLDGAGEAASDAASEASCAPVPSKCKNGVLFELDFQSIQTPPKDFIPVRDSGTLTHVADEGHCAPGLIRAATTLPNDASATSEATFERPSINGPFITARVAFAFRGPIPANDGYATVGCALLLRGTGNVRTVLRITLENDHLVYDGVVRDGDGGTSPSLSSGVELDNFVDTNDAQRWRTIDTFVTIQPLKVDVKTTFDGVELAPFEEKLLEPVTRISLECGIPYADGAETSPQVDMDDLLIELCPP